MQVVIITGGIATGKSTAARLWMECCDRCHRFDADATVRDLYALESVRARVAEIFGAAALDSSGAVDRAHLRREIIRNPDQKRQLEGLVHPLVRERCLAGMDAARTDGACCFVAEVPLYFEGGEWKPDASARVVVVACSHATCTERLVRRNPLDSTEAERIVRLQMRLPAKMAAADHCLWNEGVEALLFRQVRLLHQLLVPPVSPPLPTLFHGA